MRVVFKAVEFIFGHIEISHNFMFVYHTLIFTKSGELLNLNVCVIYPYLHSDPFTNLYYLVYHVLKVNQT